MPVLVICGVFSQDLSITLLQSAYNFRRVSSHGILANLRERDQIDSSRQIAPLRPADDAISLDTTDLDVEGVLGAIKRLIAARKT
jgi:cytidylate kinase